MVQFQFSYTTTNTQQPPSNLTLSVSWRWHGAIYRSYCGHRRFCRLRSASNSLPERAAHVVRRQRVDSVLISLPSCCFVPASLLWQQNPQNTLRPLPLPDASPPNTAFPHYVNRGDDDGQQLLDDDLAVNHLVLIASTLAAVVAVGGISHLLRRLISRPHIYTFGPHTHTYTFLIFFYFPLFF